MRKQIIAQLDVEKFNRCVGMLAMMNEPYTMQATMERALEALEEKLEVLSIGYKRHYRK